MGATSKILATTALGLAFLSPSTNNLAKAKTPSRPIALGVEEVEEKATPNINFEKAYPIKLTEEGKKYLEKIEDVVNKTRNNEDGGLIDASTFLESDQIERLNSLCGQKRVINNISLEFKKLEKEENGYKYALDVEYPNKEKEKWYISGQAYYRDQFPDGEPNWISAISIWKATDDGGIDKLTQNYIEYFQMINNPSLLLKRIEEAKENRKNEIADEATLKDDDLPRDEEIGYIGLGDPHDVIFADCLDDVKYFAEAMSAASYKMVSNEEGKYSMEPYAMPKEVIENEINLFLKKGVKTFYLKLAGHGNQIGVYFTIKKDGFFWSAPLRASELKDIFNKYTDCKFIVTTDACSAGGFARALKNYEDPTGQTGRVRAILQTKQHATNQEGRLKGIKGIKDAPKVFSTYYDVFFLHYLMKGHKYGEAHLLADRDAKVLIQCDAEGWKSSPKGGILTADIFKVIRGLTLAKADHSNNITLTP